jgi:hypothetical protein
MPHPGPGLLRSTLAPLNPTEMSIMARKPNYPFERMERERQKAAKKAEKARLKADARARGEPDPVDDGDAEDADEE